MLAAIFFVIGTVSFFFRTQLQRFEHERRRYSGGGSEAFKPRNRLFIAFRVVPFWVLAIVFGVVALTAK